MIVTAVFGLKDRMVVVLGFDNPQDLESLLQPFLILLSADESILHFGAQGGHLGEDAQERMKVYFEPACRIAVDMKQWHFNEDITRGGWKRKVVLQTIYGNL